MTETRSNHYKEVNTPPKSAFAVRGTILALWGAAVMTAAIIATVVPVSEVQAAERTDGDVELFTQDGSRAVYHLVNQRLRVRTFDSTDSSGPVKSSFETAIIRDDPADARVVIFESIDAVDRLSLEQAEYLLNEFEAGRLAVGVEGFSADLKDRFALLEAELIDAGTTSGGENRWVLLHRDPAGHINELEVAVPQNRRQRKETFSRIADWFFERNGSADDSADIFRTQKATSDDPWTSIGDFEYSGNTVGYFYGSDQTAGSYRFRLTIYNLASDQAGNDWYRLDFQTDSTIDNYEMVGNRFGDTDGKCGWWTKEAFAAVTVLSSGGDIFDFMPSATVGSTTQSYSIGGNITTSQAGINGSYSKSYGTPDVTITPSEDFAGASLHWKAGLTGCNSYGDFPFYDGASNVAKSTYVLDPSMIVSVPAGTKLKIITEDQNDKSPASWKFTAEKDYIHCGTLCATINSDQYTSSYTETRTITCTTTSCS